MQAAKPTVGRLVFLRFYGLGLPPAIEANVGHQTKQFMIRSKFDLGPPEMPLPLENVETNMNEKLYKYKDINWFPYFSVGLAPHEITHKFFFFLILCQAAAHDRSCWACSYLEGRF